MKLPHDARLTVGKTPVELSLEISASILLTIDKGWALALQWPDVRVTAREVLITERLRDGMRLALRDDDKWRGQMMVHAGTESRSRPEILLPDGRTDISISIIPMFSESCEHPHAIIECKRIAGNNSRLSREYVVEGIDRFRTGKYAGNHATGFMVGYLIAGNISEVVTGVNRYLSRKGRGNENLRQSALIQERWVWDSRHPRSDARPIDMHHAFLTFNPPHE